MLISSTHHNIGLEAIAAANMAASPLMWTCT